MMISW